MKNIIFGIAILAISLIACNNSSKSNESRNENLDTTAAQSHTKNEETMVTTSVNEILSGYLQLKNALADDNGKDAAIAGNVMVEALGKVDTTALTADQLKIYEDVADDAKEHAEHIGMNAEKIAHQREHFDMLSEDIYDLVKAFGTTETLYYDHCPMYNDNKGANWLSEAEGIKNPYFGKKMLTCGSVKEEIKSDH
jgi:hypothetical protein